MKRPSIFISGYNSENLRISKEKGLVGWQRRRKNFGIDDYVFIYDTDSKIIKSVFKVTSVEEGQQPIWEDELKTGKTKYGHRWKADLVRDRLNISLQDIREIPPFQDIRKFTFSVIRNPYPTFVNDRYPEFYEYLFQRAKLEEFSEIKNPSLWLIRAGGKGEGAQTALDNKLIGIGYGGLPELHKIKDFKTFRETYERTHLKDTKNRVGQVVPQIWNFMNKVKIGDFVILPLPPQTKLMAVGKIMDEYKFGDLHSEIQQYRPVYWLKKDVSMEEFDPEIKRWFSARGTVNHVGSIEIVNKLTDMLKSLGVTDAKLEKINHMDNIPTPDEHHENDHNLENKWLSLKDVDIKEIIQNVLTAKNKKLEIDENVVERIISHLAVSKHVILVGPPGTGKTDLARRILEEIGNRIINNPEPIETVASYEWGRYEVIGGRSITSKEGGNSFHFGCVTNAIRQKRFLLIDEFNRADMNKAFGEMFLALDHREIQLREDEHIDDIGNDTKIIIPENFRMICTMNDYDKSLLNELSYGLLRRFAFVEINVPDDKQKVKNIILERTYEKLKYLDPKFDNEKVQLYIDKFIDFLFSIKSKREIGLASYIDVISFLMHSITVMKNDPGSALNDSLIDYILPQFDRLDIETIRLAYDTASKIFDFQDGNGKTFESINPFLFNLKNRIQRLEDLNKLFKFGEAG